MHSVVEKVLVSEEEIVKRSKELGKQISEDYRKTGKAPLLVALLKGSVPFLILKSLPIIFIVPVIIILYYIYAIIRFMIVF